MAQYKEILLSVALRIIPAGLLYAMGSFIAGRVNGDLTHDFAVALVAMAFMIAAAVVIAFPLARLAGEPMGSLFYPTGRFDRPQPMYGIPESKRKKGLFEEAMAGYERIAEHFPDDAKPYIGMIEIAVMDLKDPDRATRIYERGMSALTKTEDQEALSTLYVANCSRLAGSPLWLRKEQEKVIGPRKV